MQKFSDKIFLSPPVLCGDEIKYICKAIESNWIAPAGPHIENFEEKMKKYLNRSYAAALSSGTAALTSSIKSVKC